MANEHMKKMFSIIRDLGDAKRNTMRYNFTLTKTANIQKIENIQC